MKWIYRFILLFSILSFVLVIFLILTFLAPAPDLENFPGWLQKTLSLDFETKKAIIGSLSPMIALFGAVWTVQKNHENSISEKESDRIRAIADVSRGIRSELRFMRSVLQNKKCDIDYIIKNKYRIKNIKSDRFPDFYFLFFNNNIDKISLIGLGISENIFDVYYMIMSKCEQSKGLLFYSNDSETLLKRELCQINEIEDKINETIDLLENFCQSRGIFIGKDKYDRPSIDG